MAGQTPERAAAFDETHAQARHPESGQPILPASRARLDERFDLVMLIISIAMLPAITLFGLLRHGV